jgi:hypothetical protein
VCVDLDTQELLLNCSWLVAFALAPREQKRRPRQYSGLEDLARPPNQWRGVRFPGLHPLGGDLNPQHANALNEVPRLDAADLARPKASP